MRAAGPCEKGCVVRTIGHARTCRAGPLWAGVGCAGAISLMFCVSSLKEQTVDALATGAEEGRSNLR